MGSKTPDIDMDVFRRNLMCLMKRSDMTQKDLAKTAGLTPVSISRYMTGVRTPTASSLRKLAEALLVPVETLIEEKEYMSPTIEQELISTAKELSPVLSDKEKSLLIGAFVKALLQTP